jgi:uncharacterized protein (DUF433 family)
MNTQMSSYTTVVRTGRGLSIAGTRITLYSILDYAHAGWPPKLIRDRLNLTDQQITYREGCATRLVEIALDLDA